MGVAHQDGVGRGHETLQQGGVGAEGATGVELPCRSAAQVGVDEQRVPLVGDPEAGGAEPLELEARGQVLAGVPPVERLGGADVVRVARPRTQQVVDEGREGNRHPDRTVPHGVRHPAAPLG